MRQLVELPLRTETIINGHKVVRTPSGQWYVRRLHQDAFTVTGDLPEAIALVQRGKLCSACRNVQPEGCGYCRNYDDETP